MELDGIKLQKPVALIIFGGIKLTTESENDIDSNLINLEFVLSI